MQSQKCMSDKYLGFDKGYTEGAKKWLWFKKVSVVF